MKHVLLNFWKDESGAVAVDWVVLTASIVALNALIVVGIVEDGIEEGGEKIDEQVQNARAFQSYTPDEQLGAN